MKGSCGMNIEEYVKMAFVKRKTNERQVALSMEESPQNINRKIKSDMKLSFLESIANSLNCDIDIRFIDRDTKEPLL